MPPHNVLLDTSFLLALENRDDVHHERAKLLDRRLGAAGSNYVCHWGILLEIADGYARLSRRTKALQLIEKIQSEEGYVLQPLTEPLLEEAIVLYRSRPDKEWGLTDCVSFVLMRQEGINEALTADSHFRQGRIRPPATGGSEPGVMKPRRRQPFAGPHPRTGAAPPLVLTFYLVGLSRPIQ